MFDHFAVEKYVAACCDRAGIRVVWGDEKTTPSTDGKVITLPRLSVNADLDAIKSTIHYATHESSHIRFSDFDVLQGKGQKHVYVANAFEDLRVNHLNNKEFIGDKLNEEAYIEKYTKKLEGVSLGGENATFMGPLLVTMLENTGFAVGHRAANTILKALPPEAAEKVELLRNHPGVQDMLDLRDSPEKSASAEIVRIAGKVLEDVWGITPEQDAEETAKAKAEKGEGEPQDGEEGEAEGDMAGDEEGEPIDGALMPYSEHSPPSEDGKAKPFKYVGEPSKSYTGSYTPDRTDMMYIDDYPKGKVGRGYECPSTTDEINAAITGADALADVVRRKLQVVLRSRWEHCQRKGKLDQRSLWRVGVPHDHYAERIFKRKIDNTVVDCAVSLLVDSSGSMCGRKFVHAAAGSIILNNVFNNVLGMPTEILGFTEVHRRNTIAIIKGFGDRVHSPDMARYFGRVSSYLWDNVDGESIMFGYHRLMQRPEKRKLMIVLSDGMPHGGYGKGSINFYTTKVIDFIEKESKVDLIGVGIEDSAVRKFYKNHTVLDNCDELEAKMLELVQTTVFKTIKEK